MGDAEFSLAIKALTLHAEDKNGNMTGKHKHFVWIQTDIFIILGVRQTNIDWSWMSIEFFSAQKSKVIRRSIEN